MTGWVDDGDGAAAHRMHRAWLRFTMATLRCRASRLTTSPTSSTSSPRLQTGLQGWWWDDGATILVHCRIDQDALEEHLVEQLLQAIRRCQVQPLTVLQQVERLGEMLLHQSSVSRVAVQFALDGKDAAGELVLFLLEQGFR